TVSTRDVIHEQRAVDVFTRTARPACGAGAEPVVLIELACERGRAYDHLVPAAVRAAVVGEFRLDTDGHAFDVPGGHAHGREHGPRRGQSPEDRAQQPAEPAGYIEVEDVCELVRDHELDPVARVLELQHIG